MKHPFWKILPLYLIPSGITRSQETPILPFPFFSLTSSLPSKPAFTVRLLLFCSRVHVHALVALEEGHDFHNTSERCLVWLLIGYSVIQEHRRYPNWYNRKLDSPPPSTPSTTHDDKHDHTNRRSNIHTTWSPNDHSHIRTVHSVDCKCYGFRYQNPCKTTNPSLRAGFEARKWHRWHLHGWRFFHRHLGSKLRFWGSVWWISSDLYMIY